MFNYDFINDDNLHYLRTYKYKGVDNSLIYRYILSPLAEYCLQYIPLNMAPNILTLLGLMCILIPHFLYLIILENGPFDGDVPSWLLWLTIILHLIYMNFDNLDGKQARRTKNSSPLGMILDHNFDSLIIMLQCTNLATACQFGSSIHSYCLYSVSSIPFYIIAHEEYYTHEMNLPIINAAAEGTLSIAFFFGLAAVFGCQVYLTRIEWFFNLQLNHAIMVLFFFLAIFGLIFVFLKIKKFVPIKEALLQQRYLLFCYAVLAHTHMRSIFYLIGFTMSKSVGIVALCHVSNQNLPQYLNSIYLFILILVNSISGQILGTHLVDEGMLMVVCAFIAFLIHIHFLYNTCRQVSQALNIKIFQINK